MSVAGDVITHMVDLVGYFDLTMTQTWRLRKDVILSDFTRLSALRNGFQCAY
jgi:hypothetical protein